VIDMFRGFDNVMGADEPTVLHSNGLYAAWREQCVIRGWLDDDGAA
jgi:hypothetical protein